LLKDLKKPYEQRLDICTKAFPFWFDIKMRYREVYPIVVKHNDDMRGYMTIFCLDWFNYDYRLMFTDEADAILFRLLIA